MHAGLLAVHGLDAESGPVQHRLGFEAVVNDPDHHLNVALGLHESAHDAI